MDERIFIRDTVGRARRQPHKKPYQRVIVGLADALVLAVERQGHKWGCSAGRGMERDCTCGWTDVKELAKSITPSACISQEKS
jgi:hypothetical protein